MRYFIDNFQCPKDWDSFDYCFSLGGTNIDDMLSDIKCGWAKWTIDRNSQISEGDMIIFMCAVTSKDNMGRMRTAVKRDGTAEEIRFAEEQYLKYKDHAGKLLSIGVVTEILDSSRMALAMVDKLQGFNNPILHEEIREYISISKTGIMTPLSDAQSKQLLKLIKTKNPAFDMSIYDEDSGIVNEIEEINNSIDKLDLVGDEVDIISKRRINQSSYRKLLIEKYRSCCLCDISDERLLLASHIIPWSKSSPKQKTDINNGLLLCPNHDKLFDGGFITFDSNKRIMISNRVNQKDCELLNINNDMKVRCLDGAITYLDYHRREIFDKFK